MIHVFVLLLVGVFGGTVANDTPADPFPTAEACQAAAESLIAFAKAHGGTDPYTLACIPMVIMQGPEKSDQTRANEDPKESIR